MFIIRSSLLIPVLLLFLAGVQQASAAIIVDSLGNMTPGFLHGDIPDTPTVGSAQSGQAAPFNQSLGNDILADMNASGSWSHNYDLLGNPIQSAFFDFGIVDHDSAASGNQVALFTIDGIDLTTELNALFEGSGGGDGEYNMYQLDLASVLGSLADGTANFFLGLTGPGQQTCLIFLCPDPANPVTDTLSNGANYIFSTLTITTEDSTPPNPVSRASYSFAACYRTSWYPSLSSGVVCPSIARKSIINS